MKKYLFTIIGFFISNTVYSSTFYLDENQKLSYCQNPSECVSYNLPNDLLIWFKKDWITDVRIDKFADDKYYLLITGNNNDVNVCYENISQIKDKNIVDNRNNIYLTANHDILCNYQILSRDRLVSSYRSGARWFDKMYHYENGQYVLKALDEHFGGFIRRTIYKSEGVEKRLVSEFESAQDYDKRKPLNGIVKISKSYLYKNFDAKQSRQYLIQGDQVKLLDYKYAINNFDVDRFFVEYINKQHDLIRGWVNTIDIKIIQ